MKNYHDNHEWISAGLLKKFVRSPLKAKTAMDQPSEQSEALTLGSCFHEMMESPDEFYSFTVFNNDDRPEPDKTFGSKLNKQWKESIYLDNDLVISSDQYETLKLMVESLKRSQFYKSLIGQKLESIEEGYYTEFGNNKAKCKPDALYNGADDSIICVDWKTTAESLTASPGHMTYIIRKLGYDIQAVHYTEVLKNVLNKDVHFFFVFVEKTAPFEVVPVYINPQGDLYNETFEKWNIALSEVNECFKTGVWPTLESKLTNKIITL